MRIKIGINLADNIIACDYRRAFMSLFKTALTVYADGEFFPKFFPQGKPERKDYAFAVGLPQGSVCKGDHYNLSGDTISVTVTSSDPAHFMSIANAFRSLKRREDLHMGGTACVITSVWAAPDDPIRTDKILVEFLSPLCIRVHKDRKDYYLTTENTEFMEQLRRNLSYQLRGSAVTDQMIREFMLIPVKMRKTVAKFYNSPVACSLGSAVLCGDPILLKELYDAGIGSRCSSGFGVFRILQS